MPQTPILHVTLSEDALKFVKQKVSTGEYASESDVIIESVAAMQEQQSALERWIHDEALPAYDRILADPSRGISLQQVRSNLAARRSHL